ncbi:uncharacterized protein LOC103697522 [Phoenix dactylifera]|uniref:Uncharacterized protein LOC103697522 n=1 Tax=Phoenix dactylifera TaxID=42345 RepID=A0A8B7BIH2_PHODC|nr:uncharacterized protein LOC103697522 [Phoenix dactylifera]
METMGYRKSSSSTWVFSLKAMVASVVVLSAALMLHLRGASILGFLVSEIPRMYGFLLSWLTPPYLYFVINGIILSIAASSRFQKPAPDGQDPARSAPSMANPTLTQLPEYMPPAEEYAAKIAEDVQPEPEFVAPAEYEGEEVVGLEVAAAAEEAEGEEEFVISRSSWSPQRRESRETATATDYLAVTEKPLVSVRFGRRKNVKPSPEGKALRVARAKRGETLESTWRTITDGRPVPLARHLKKSDTWETHGRSLRDEQSPAPLMRKSETFNDSSPSPSSSSSSRGRLRKEPSLGQDDLNRRVEAFIKKFNEEMRLQRQESFNHYLEMINRGSH